MSKETEEEFKKLLFDEIHIQPNTYDIDTKQLCDDVVQELKTQGFIISQWRPIEEAPKDGTKLLLLTNQEEIEVGSHYTREVHDYVEVGDGLYKKELSHTYETWECTSAPTHFMPLPPSPEGEE